MNSKYAYLSLSIIILGVGIFLGFNWHIKSVSLPADLSGWQAVFLSDGQAYFGQLEDYNRKFYMLTNIYYLKYGSSLQQDPANTGSDKDVQKLNLIKLGDELHGPQDAMYIVKDKVLFIENLKNDSQVVRAIKGKLNGAAN